MDTRRQLQVFNEREKRFCVLIFLVVKAVQHDSIPIAHHLTQHGGNLLALDKEGNTGFEKKKKKKMVIVKFVSQPCIGPRISVTLV